MGEKPPSALSRFRSRNSSAVEKVESSPEARRIHDRVDALSELLLRDVMTPRVDVDFLRAPVTPEQVAEAVRDTGHSCFPVVEGDLDDVIGVLYVNDLFRSSTARRAIGVSLPDTKEITRKIRRALMLPETLDLLEGLKEMRNQRRTFALVLDEHGGVAGVISLRDILEQLVGDLSDEFDGDDEPEVQKVREGRWLVDGQIHVDRFNDELGVELPEGDYVTLAGFLLSRADEIPGEGDDILWGDWRFKVQSMDKRRISEVIVEQLPETAVEPEELP